MLILQRLTITWVLYIVSWMTYTEGKRLSDVLPGYLPEKSSDLNM